MARPINMHFVITAGSQQVFAGDLEVVSSWIQHGSNIQMRLNGETMQDGNTAEMIFDIPTCLATLTRGLSLEPGDIIATGTPNGVGMAQTPPRWLRAGDVMEVEIEGIGVLRNPVG